jgi:hypothetical protein
VVQQTSEQAGGLLNYSSTLKMEAIRSSETSGATQRTTRRHIPDDTLNIFMFFQYLRTPKMSSGTPGGMRTPG